MHKSIFLFAFVIVVAAGLLSSEAWAGKTKTGGKQGQGNNTYYQIDLKNVYISSYSSTKKSG